MTNTGATAPSSLPPGASLHPASRSRIVLLGLFLALVAPLSWGVYEAVLRLTPLAVLLQLRSRGSQTGRATPNVPVYNDRITEADRLVPLPNPDFLYTIVSYDLRSGPLRITGPLPKPPRVSPATYWSLAFYGLDTVNFFVTSDREIPEETYDLVLVPPGFPEGARAPLKGAHTRVVEATSDRGVILSRSLLMSDEMYPSLREVQKELRVTPATSP